MVSKQQLACYHKLVKLSSIPLRQIDEKRDVVGIASGCMIIYCNKKILLSVSHATENGGSWVIELEFHPGKGTALYPICMNFLKLGSIDSGDVRSVDFSYTLIPTETISYYQEVLPDHSITLSQERVCFTPNFDINVSQNELYAFSGLTEPNITEDKKSFFTESKVVLGLKYLSTDEDFYTFKLPYKHPGHEFFEGCSGAPIIDTQGNVVALVCGGNIKDHTIIGINLNKYKIALDILVGNFGLDK